MTLTANYQNATSAMKGGGRNASSMPSWDGTEVAGSSSWTMTLAPGERECHGGPPRCGPRARHSAACACGAGSFHTSLGLRAASVSSSRARGAKCGALLRLASPALARSATLRSAPMN